MQERRQDEWPPPAEDPEEEPSHEGADDGPKKSSDSEPQLQQSRRRLGAFDRFAHRRRSDKLPIAR